MRLLLASLGLASAQDWGTQGSWEQISPMPAAPGGRPNGDAPTFFFHRASYVPGYFLVPGVFNDSARGGQLYADLWLYNIAKNTWVNPYEYPAPLNPGRGGGGFVDPSIFVQGGNVVMYDARSTASPVNPPSMYVLDSMAPFDTAFSQVKIPPSPDQSYGPQGRSGVRYFEWGSYLFAFGGSLVTPCCSYGSCQSPCPANQTFNDMWIMELGWNVFQSDTGPFAPWTQVSPPAVGGLVPGYPPPRIGASITPFHTHTFLFGGVSRSDPTADPAQCIYSDPRNPTPPPTDCFFHSHVHGVQPSGMTGAVTMTPGAPASAYPDTSALQLPGSQWAQLGAGNMIPGRADHTAGAMGNQFFVYGGVTAPGVRVSDLWAYNLVSQTWAQVAAPNGPPVGYAVAEVIGMSYYVLSQNADFPRPGQPSVPPAPAALWRWRPTFGGSSGGSSASPAYDPAIVQGHTAGIVIGILIGLANLYFLVLIALGQGLDLIPTSLANCIPTLGGGAKPPSGGAFYTAASANGEYTAPAAL